jgi:KDO2-lipid IV(A) lauroyltransferase
MSILGAFFFFFAVIFIGLFPFPFLYAFANFIKLVIYRLIGYRKEVVKQNLEGSFPGITKNEVDRLTNLFYKNLADVFIESIKAFTMSRKQIHRRHRIINPEVLDHFYNSGQSVIGVTAHYNNWEWGSLSASLQTKFKVIAFYKQLNNKYIDRFVLWSRSRFGTTLASIKETTLTFETFKDAKTIFLMASDQGMPKHIADKSYWVNFLHRDTPFLYGLEKHARLNNLPVIYTDIQRVKRGFYTIELTVLTANPLELEEGVLTEMYARKLESVIVKKPENWLWSHRRWKFSR